MKIGILTHHYISNFGAFLQAYALQEAVSREFPDDTVEIINYINWKHFVVNFGGWFRFYPDRENFHGWQNKVKVPFAFAKARRKDMHLSPMCSTAEQINRLGYDVIIIGSDEVWNYKDKKSKADIKYGHGLSCRNLISYAPSVGDSYADVPDYVRTGIEKFRNISARDEMTAKLVEEISGTAAERVLDPICLTEFPSRNMQGICKPYILFYYCDHLPDSIKDQILSYAHTHRMAVYGAGECGTRYDADTVNIHPFEWVDMFKNAEFVFTGTFHGALFSILNKRQFWVYLTNKSRICKVGGLLKEFEIKNREVDADFKIETAERIDYSIVSVRLAERREQSLGFLRKAIEEARESNYK